jgi:hypothetical protein
MDAKGALIHRHVRPDLLDNVALGNDLAGVVDQNCQNVERAAP